jgi:hypothetical protein
MITLVNILFILISFNSFSKGPTTCGSPGLHFDYDHYMGISYDQYHNTPVVEVPNVCTDSSLSYSDPGSLNMGYEGPCGDVTASDVATAMCRKIFNFKYFRGLKGDVAPGTLPTTLAKKLNHAFQDQNMSCSCPEGEWKSISARNRSQFHELIQSSLEKGNLVPILYKTPSSFLNIHWSTIVSYKSNKKIKSCYYKVNSYGKQYTYSCDDLADYSQKIDQYFPFIRKYTVLMFE